MNKNNNKKTLITTLSCTFALAAYLIAESVGAEPIPPENIISHAENKKILPSVEQVLKQISSDA